MQSVLLAIRDPAQAAAWHEELCDSATWALPMPVHTFREARRWALQRTPDLLVTDLRLCDGSATEMIRMLHPAQGVQRGQVLVLCERDDDPLLLDALQAGADNFLVTRQVKPGAIVTRVRETLAGGADVAPWIARRMLEHFGHQGTGGRGGRVEDISNPLSLTSGEQTLLRRLSVGERLADVARQQGVRPLELTARLRAIYLKMQWALRAGDLRLN